MPHTCQAVRTLLVVAEDLGGSIGYVRFEQPFAQLADSGFQLRPLGSQLSLVRRGDDAYGIAPATLDGVAGVIFPQLVTSPTLPDGRRLELAASVCDEAERRGIPILYSTDDYLPAIEQSNPMFGPVVASLRNLLVVLERADAFIVTTRPLAQALERHGKPVHIIPNAIDPARWKLRPRSSGELRVGWHGSNTHVEDLLLLLPAIRELQRRQRFTLRIFGVVDGSLEEKAARLRACYPDLTVEAQQVADAFVQLVDELRGVDHLHLPFGEMSEFFETLPRLDLDVGLCPLVDTEFNSFRSALKFYENAAVGSFSLASDVPAYRDEVSVCVPNRTADWVETLERYLTDPESRERELERQRAFVLEHRSIAALAPRWVEALEATLSR